MKFQVDDWHFVQTENDVVALELYLDNGQKAVMEILPLCYTQTGTPAGNEIVVWCEMPGEIMVDATCKARWVSRPPNANSPWSHVELPDILLQQIENRITPRSTRH